MNAADAYDAYLAAICAGDRRAAFVVVDGAAAGGLDLRAIYLDVLQPAMREIGRRWQENRLSVAQEHLATAITQSVMARLYGQSFEAAAVEGRTLIAACADVERHEMGLRMLSDFLEMEGWNVVYLGATVPVESLVEMVRERRPDALALSVSIAPHLPRLEAVIAAVREAMGEAAPLIVAGGRPFHDRPELAIRLGADMTALDAREAAERIRDHFLPAAPR